MTTREPSGLNAATFTVSACPDNVAKAAPVLVSHNLAVLSADAVTIREPSGLNVAWTLDPCAPKGWPTQRLSNRPTIVRCYRTMR